MSSLRPRLVLALSLLAASTAASLAACVGDEPATIAAAPADDAATTPTPGQDASPGADTGTADAADAGQDAAPKRFCQTQAPLTGVTDFFCADFDGTKADEGFTKALVPDGGAVTLTTDIFFSPPASLVTKGGATLLWEKVGATPFAEAEVNVRVNVGNLGGVVPPSTGSLVIVKMQSIDTHVDLRYTRGGSVAGSTYTGYYMQAVFCPGPCGIFEMPLTNQLPTNVWTNVQMIWQKTGAVKISFNGVSVLDATGAATGAATTSTKLGVELGTVAQGAPVGVGGHTFDNLIVSVKRD